MATIWWGSLHSRSEREDRQAGRAFARRESLVTREKFVLPIHRRDQFYNISRSPVSPLPSLGLLHDKMAIRSVYLLGMGQKSKGIRGFWIISQSSIEHGGVLVQRGQSRSADALTSEIPRLSSYLIVSLTSGIHGWTFDRRGPSLVIRFNN